MKLVHIISLYVFAILLLSVLLFNGLQIKENNELWKDSGVEDKLFQLNETLLDLKNP